MTQTDARVAQIVAPSRVQVNSIPVGEVGPADLLVQTLHTGISAGTEMNVYRGVAAQWRTVRDPQTGLFEPTDEPEWTYPLTYGYAAVGCVQEVGDQVSGFAVGDLVFSYSPHASLAVVPAEAAIALPELSDPRIGVLNANLNTALNGVLDLAPRFGETVVVSGLGVIGLLVVQILRRQGIRTIAVDGVASRRDLALRFGAAEVLEPGPSVARRVREMTDNRGADGVIEVSGASAALNEAIRIVGYNGTIVALSWYGGSFESLSLTGEFHHNRPRIIASQVAGLGPHLGPLWSLPRRQEVVLELLLELDLAPLMTHDFSLEEAKEAYALVDARPDDLIQCTLSVDA